MMALCPGWCASSPSRGTWIEIFDELDRLHDDIVVPLTGDVD